VAIKFHERRGAGGLFIQFVGGCSSGGGAGHQGAAWLQGVCGLGDGSARAQQGRARGGGSGLVQGRVALQERRRREGRTGKACHRVWRSVHRGRGSGVLSRCVAVALHRKRSASRRSCCGRVGHRPKGFGSPFVGVLCGESELSPCTGWA
jgi:hypothetical protein